MSVNFQKRCKALGNRMFNVEKFNTAEEVVSTCERRKITDSSFHNMQTYSISEGWHGVNSYQEALDLMRGGYAPAVEKMRANIRPNVAGVGKRISFFNDVVGYAPVVPLAILGVPTNMMNSYMKPIKAKVLNVYYDITVSAGTDPDDIMKAGEKVLQAIQELEMSGYRFNLYAIQAYTDSSVDMLCTKVKDANMPLDLKRVSFPLTHTAYFRVIGFDWYSKTPHGKYRSCYGHQLHRDFDDKQLTEGFKELFNEECTVLCAGRIIRKGVEAVKDILTAGNAPKKGGE